MHASITKHKYAAPFKRPVTEKEAPDYHEVIKNPMDLQTLKKLLESGEVATVDALVEKLVVQRGAGVRRPGSGARGSARGRRYVQNLCADATAVSRLRDQKLDTGCFLLSIRSQTPKYLRCQDLLEMRARLKEVRKIGPGQDD